MANPPVLGAAMPIAQLAAHQAWILEHNRDLEIQNAFDPKFLDSDKTDAVSEVKRALAGYTGRMGIHGPFEGINVSSIDAEVRAVATKRMCQALVFAGRIGATHMVWHSPVVTFGHPFIQISPAYDVAAYLERVHDTLKEPLRMATEIGCTLVMENIMDSNPAVWMMVVRSFNSANLRASIDVGHSFIMHRTGGASPDAFVREAGAMLEHVHLQDTDGLSDRHWMPGSGTLNWYALFDALKRLSHTPRLIIEVRDHSEIIPGAQWLAARGFGL